MRFKRPGSIRTQLSWNSEGTQKGTRFHVARDDQRIVDVALAHRLNEPVHVPRFATVGEGKLVFSGSQTERTNHHGGKGIGKFAFKHRAFASDYSVIGADFVEEERRKYIGEMNLTRAFEVAFGALEILRHDAEIDVLRAKNMADLPQHFLNAHIATGIARAVIARKEELQLFAGRPALAEAEHPAEARDFNQGADPSDEEEIGHARILPAATFFTAPVEAGQGLAGKWNLFSRQYFRSGAA